MYAITAEIKKYKSIVKQKKRKYDKIVLLTKSKLNSIEVLIPKALTDSNISHDEFALINNVLQECDEAKEEIKNLIIHDLIVQVCQLRASFRISSRQFTEDFSLFIKHFHHNV